MFSVEDMFFVSQAFFFMFVVCVCYFFSASQQVKQTRLFEFKQLMHTSARKATMQILDYNCQRAITFVYSRNVLEETRHYIGEIASLDQICQAATCVSTHGTSVMQFHVNDCDPCHQCATDVGCKAVLETLDACSAESSHRDTNIHRHTQTHIRTDTQAYTDTETHRHTQTHTDTQTDSHTETHTDTETRIDRRHRRTRTHRHT